MAGRRNKLTVSEPKTWAAGIPGVAGAMSDSLHEMGPARSLTTLRALNQRSGFDCPGCAWPEGKKHHIAEFCENGREGGCRGGHRPAHRTGTSSRSTPSTTCESATATGSDSRAG